MGPGGPGPENGSQSHERTKRTQGTQGTQRSVPTLDEQRAILAALIEQALSTWRRNGRAPRPDVQHVLSVLALGSPATVAALCPHLLAALPGDVRRAVLGQASAPPVTRAWPTVPPLAHWLTIGQAAAQLGITEHAVRARCRRGQLPADKHRVTGAWRIDPAGIEPTRAGSE